jgi:hypothetical protein
MSARTPVLTKAQAKSVTRGRTPLVPVEYEEAIKALEACCTLDEAKYWGDKADALAAWAKIYHSDTAQRRARQLKLHAYRRMAVLAEELRPRKWRPGADNKRNGSSQGAKSLLIEHGLRDHDAVNATFLARMPKREFAELTNRPSPPTPNTARSEAIHSAASAAYKMLHDFLSLERFCTFCINHKARIVAKGLTVTEAEKLRGTAVRISEWLDEFEQHLPRSKSL